MKKVLVVEISRPDPIDGRSEVVTLSPIGPFESDDECEEYYVSNQEKIQSYADKRKCFPWDTVKVIGFSIDTILEP